MRSGEVSIPLRKAGLLFRNPFIIASGPASKSVEQLEEAEEAGWGGVSIKLTFDPEPYINPPPRYRWFSDSKVHIFSLETRLNMEEGLRLVEEGRRRTRELIIFANITYVGDKGVEGWAEMAKRFEGAGAHAIELNFCCPNMSFNLEMVGEVKSGSPLTGASLGLRGRAASLITEAVKNAVRVPVFVKLTPEGSNIGEIAKAAVDAGADGVCGTANRLGVPPIDIYNPRKSPYRLTEGTSLGCISGAWIKPLALRDVLQMRRSVGPDPVVIGTGGVETFRDAVEMIMIGADLVGICTAVMLKGFGVVREIARGVKRYLHERGKEHIYQIRDEAIPHFKPVTELKPIPGYARVIEERCTGCGRCLKIAHCNAIIMRNDKASVKPERCLGCSTCVDICPKNAIEMVRR